MGVREPGASDERGKDAVLRDVASFAGLGAGSRAPGPHAVHERLLALALRLPGIQHADLLLVGSEARLQDALHAGPSGTLERYAVRPSRGGTLLDWVLATQEAARAGEVSEAAVGPDLCRWGVRGLAAFPVSSGGKPVAVLALGCSERDGPYDDALEAAGALVAVAGALLALAGAQQAARHDPLTGCLNHGAMLDRTEEELSRAARSGRPLGCVLLDLDGFKSVNDRFGHLAGDLLLEAVGGALRAAFRLGDLVARYGGDEFVILVPDADQESLRAAAERCGQVVRAVQPPDPWGARLGDGVRATVGADLSRTADSAATLLARADRALALGKHAGKDRVIVAASHPDDLGIATSRSGGVATARRRRALGSRP